MSVPVVRGLSDEIAEQIKDGGIDSDLKLDANRAMREIRTERNIVVAADGYEQFLLSFVQRERAKFQADDPDDHRYDGERVEPLCGCPDPFCAIKRGNLPRPVRAAEDIDAGIATLMQTHEGYPSVLDEGREAFHRLVGEVEGELTLIAISLANGVSLSALRERDDGAGGGPDDAEHDIDPGEVAADAAPADD